MNRMAKVSVIVIAFILILMPAGCAKENNKKSTTSIAAVKETTTVKGMPTGKITALEKAALGDTVYFGRYEQDDNLKNGKEQIAWRVLAAENGKALLISEMILDSRPYHYVRESISWETCSLRNWLNADFFNSVFTAAEKAKILTSDLVNKDNSAYKIPGGNDTKDKVFLLSLDEAKEYLGSIGVRSASGTEWAKSEGLFVYPESPYEGKGSWWLRSPGAHLVSAADVFYNGDTGNVYDFIDNFNIGVRPAVWVNTAV